MLVLLQLSAAFDTIDHVNMFCIFEKYVGICRNALKLIKSYFPNPFMLTCSMMRFLSLLLLGMCVCVVIVVLW